MNEYKFFQTTCETLNALAKLHGVHDLEKYYKSTDAKEINDFENLNEIQQTFAQIALHGQNATRISNIVRFKENFVFIKDITRNFTPCEFLVKYASYNDEEKVKKLVEDLRYDETKNLNGLKWNSKNNKSENQDTMITRYANILFDAAEYLKRFDSKEQIINDLKEHNKDGYKSIIKYFRKEVIKHGFGVALTCDFLKEYDEEFSDLVKPDIHIKDTLCALKKHNKNYYSTDKKLFECIDDMQELVESINVELKKNNEHEITAYQLDKMIWLICSENFYLDDNTVNTKQLYLRKIRK